MCCYFSPKPKIKFKKGKIIFRLISVSNEKQFKYKTEDLEMKWRSQAPWLENLIWNNYFWLCKLEYNLETK